MVLYVFIIKKGKHGTSNDSEKMLIGFAIEYDLRIVSTCFRHKYTHLGLG